MTLSNVNDSKHWRDRAAEMRALSEEMTDNEARTMMLRLASDYDKLGDRADIRANGGTPPEKRNWALADPAGPV